MNEPNNEKTNVTTDIEDKACGNATTASSGSAAKSPLDRAKEEAAKKPVRRKYVRKNIEQITKAKLELQAKRNASRVPRDENKCYVTNKQLLEELEKWRDSGDGVTKPRVISEQLGKYFLLISERLTNHSSWKNYSKDIHADMVSQACFKMIQGLDNYNFAFSNPFAYFTRTAWNAFLSVVGKYYRYLNFKREAFRDAVERLDMNGVLASKVIRNPYDVDSTDEISDPATEES